MDRRISFLYASIADIQGTIRLLDAKVVAILVILSIPLTKFGSIFPKLKTLWMVDCCLGKLLVAIFCLLWMAAFIAAVKTLFAIDNPAAHVVGDKPQGTFYSPVIFSATFLDSFFNFKKKSAVSLDDYIEKLPLREKEVVRELAFEQMKIAYIRTIKLRRSQTTFSVAFWWIMSGGLVWVLNLLFF